MSVSHEERLSPLRQFFDKALYTESFYSWTGTTSLGQYFQFSLASIMIGL
ncbi:ClbS/DfsB family four-helix bundle protein [Lactococcus muris]|uniref:ClbS/DfsB family four-helix bundle protein n=1 Tax=Lactococcus muris TaxID=2941330 RepID=A0ABV4D6L4_9LACT|nr:MULTISPECIES: ClbS/DfsB family four-helix bundle protein [Lactococcus]